MPGAAAPILSGEVFRRLLVARDRIEDSYGDALTLDELARSAGLSSFHFLREFSRAFGATPREYLVRVRLERACERLERGASVTGTCFEVGYESLGSFSALFSRRLGRSPQAYQREVRRIIQAPGPIAVLRIPGCLLAAYCGGALDRKIREAPAGRP